MPGMVQYILEYNADSDDLCAIQDLFILKRW